MAFTSTDVSVCLQKYYEYTDQRSASGELPQNDTEHPPCFVFETTSLTSLELTNLAKLACQQAPGICLSAPPSPWIERIQPHSWLFFLTRVLRSQSHILTLARQALH